MGWNCTSAFLCACIDLLWGDLYLYTGEENVMAFCLRCVGDCFCSQLNLGNCVDFLPHFTGDCQAICCT